jgi:hypothetical protein
MATTYAQDKAANETFVSWLETGQEKRAEDAINSFTRLRVREDGVHRRIQEYIKISNDELDRDIQDKPIKWIDKEPDGPAAISVPFASLPMNVYIKGPRYRVLFSRILSPNFTKDVDELRTWHMDIRQVLSDNMIKDMLYEEDNAFFTAVNFTMGGSAGASSPINSTVTWGTVSGGITRDGWNDAMKIMPRTFARLEPTRVLINNISIHEVMKWGRDEMGGDYSQDIAKNGFSEMKLFGKEVLVTIKQDLVPDDSIYMFADEKFLGKAFVLEDTTMSVRKDRYFIEFGAWETIGSAIANGAAVARADF